MVDNDDDDDEDRCSASFDSLGVHLDGGVTAAIVAAIDDIASHNITYYEAEMKMADIKQEILIADHLLLKLNKLLRIFGCFALSFKLVKSGHRSAVGG